MNDFVFDKYPKGPSRRRRSHDILQRNEYAAKSRAQLVIRCLGFRSFWQLGEVAGVNHITVAHLLYKPGQGSYMKTFNQVFSAMREGFDRNKKRMKTAERQFIREFMQDWAKTTIMDGIAREKIKRQKSADEMEKKALNQRYARQKRKLDEQLRLIEATF